MSAKTHHLRDPITLLPSRQQFAADYRAAPDCELVLITLTDAAHYNQLLRAIGHEHADNFVRAGVTRLQSLVPAALTLYHVSYLSLAFLSPGRADEALLRSIHTAFSKPIMLAGIPLGAEIAIGVAACLAKDANDVLRAALTAAQDSRAAGTEWSHYNGQSDKANQRGFAILSCIAEALQSPDQLSLNYQPKYDMFTGRITGAEALLRWQHPKLGAISPVDFIPLAEATAHIHSLTDWVLHHALAQAARWRRDGFDIVIAINVSPRNLAKPGFAERVRALLTQYGVNPRRIELEFTEGSLMTNDQVTLAELTALRACGIRVALDDFGTGFANFSYITHLPADIIKIDKSFIFKICTDERSALVVRALIKIAHRLGYCVVAEGIENEMACQMLAAWQCDEGQGFYMSRPLTAERFTAVLHQDPRLHEEISPALPAPDSGLSPLNRLQSGSANIETVAGVTEMVKAT